MSTFLITDGFGGDQYEYITGGLDSAAVSGFFITNGLGGSISEYLLDGLAASGILSQSVTTCTTTSWTGYSLQENQTPAVAVGDSFYADLLTTPGGYSVTVNGDGTVVVDTHGDTTRQRFQADIYDVSLSAFYGSFSVYINNHGPQLNVQPANVAVLTNNAMTAINFTPTDPTATHYIVDGDADPMTGVQISGSLPTGVTMAGNILSGTPTSAISNNVTFRFTDTVGAYVDCTINYLADVGATVPNVVGKTLGEAINDLTGVGLVLDPASTTDYSASVPFGNVVSQNVTAGSRVFSGSTVKLVSSLGPASDVVVPNCVGLILADAVTAATAVSLVPTTTVITYRDDVLAGRVTAQVPAAGTGAIFGSSIVFTIAAPTWLLSSYLPGISYTTAGLGFAR